MPPSKAESESYEALPTSQLLEQCSDGNQAALDEVFARVYRELRAIAHSARRGRVDTIGTTGLVHEAYLKLSGASKLSLADRRHFCRTAAKAMRQILINAAEARLSQKRGAGQPHVSLIDEMLGNEQNQQQIIDVGKAVETLHEMDPRMAQIVELRYFAGYTSEECAELLDISVPTVQRDWRLARAWLGQSLSADSV